MVMCLCLFDINHTSTFHIQITSDFSCTIRFLLYQHTFYYFHLLHLLGLLLYSPYCLSYQGLLMRLKWRFCWQHISCQQHTYHCYHCCHNLVLIAFFVMFGVTDCPHLFSCLLCLSFALRLQLHHHIMLYWDHKWSFHLHPICYYLPLSTIGYHHFFLHVVSQTALLTASLFGVAVYKFLIRLLFMFMSPWKVSEPLSIWFPMVLTSFFYYWHLLHVMDSQD